MEVMSEVSTNIRPKVSRMENIWCEDLFSPLTLAESTCLQRRPSKQEGVTGTVCAFPPLYTLPILPTPPCFYFLVSRKAGRKKHAPSTKSVLFCKMNPSSPLLGDHPRVN
jgi:hypothetical protein